MPRSKDIIADRFEVVKEIGRGTFSRVYLALDNDDGKKKCALKYETLKRRSHTKLREEANTYNALKNGLGIAQIYWLGNHGHDNVMAMQLLGPSMSNLLEDGDGKFSPKTVSLVADQMLKRIEYVHDKGYIHRDIKPGNFAIGRGRHSDEVFVIDFGLAKKYKDDRNGEHIPFVRNKKFVGTPRYGSINAHAGREQSRRDDLEAIGYMLVYFWFGVLPWHGVEESDKEKRNERILQAKREWRQQSLKTQPWPLRKYMQYAYSLEFEEVPDYHYLRGLFRAYAKEQGFEYNRKFDWCE